MNLLHYKLYFDQFSKSACMVIGTSRIKNPLKDIYIKEDTEKFMNGKR